MKNVRMSFPERADVLMGNGVSAEIHAVDDSRKAGPSVSGGRRLFFGSPIHRRRLSSNCLNPANGIRQLTDIVQITEHC